MLLMYIFSYVLNMKDRLCRVILDEAHVYITERCYRPALENLTWLSCLPCPRYAITGTMPPGDVNTFIDAMEFRPDAHVIREPCIQRNIKFHFVRTQPNMNITQLVIRSLTVLRKFGDSNRKQIVFCVNKTGVTSFMGSLRDKYKCLHAFNAEMKDDEKKKSIDAWKASKDGIMIATTGLMAGIDEPNVNGIIFAEMTYGFIDFIQGCGRGGRDGSICHAISICNGRFGHQLDSKGAEDAHTADLVDYHEDRTMCFRTKIARVMDGGLDVKCDTINDCVRCSFCDPHDEMSWRFAQLHSGTYCTPRDMLPSNINTSLEVFLSQGQKRKADTSLGGERVVKRFKYDGPVIQAQASEGTYLYAAGKHDMGEALIEKYRDVDNAVISLRTRCIRCFIVFNRITDPEGPLKAGAKFEWGRPLCSACYVDDFADIKRQYNCKIWDLKHQNMKVPEGRKAKKYCWACYTPYASAFGQISSHMMDENKFKDKNKTSLEHSQGKASVHNYADMLLFMAVYLHYDEGWRSKALKQANLAADTTVRQWLQWCMCSKPGLLFNLLDVAVWFSKEMFTTVHTRQVR